MKKYFGSMRKWYIYNQIGNRIDIIFSLLRTCCIVIFSTLLQIDEYFKRMQLYANQFYSCFFVFSPSPSLYPQYYIHFWKFDI